MRDLLPSLRGLVALPRCLLCLNHTPDLLCGPCWRDLPRNTIACPRCALPLAASEPHLCRRCARSAPPYAAALTAFHYAAPVDRAIHRLKYHADFLSARWLGEGLAAAASARGTSHLPALLIAVPLHPTRLRARGYNQAQELVRVASAELGVADGSRLARRIRATEDQIGQSATQRRRNLRGAFQISPAIAGHRVALVDDVMTTGSTLAELAQACRAAAAASVEAWAVARVA